MFKCVSLCKTLIGIAVATKQGKAEATAKTKTESH